MKKVQGIFLKSFDEKGRMIVVYFSTQKALSKENTGVLYTYYVIGQKSKNP